MRFSERVNQSLPLDRTAISIVDSFAATARIHRGVSIESVCWGTLGRMIQSGFETFGVTAVGGRCEKKCRRSMVLRDYRELVFLFLIKNYG